MIGNQCLCRPLTFCFKCSHSPGQTRVQIIFESLWGYAFTFANFLLGKVFSILNYFKQLKRNKFSQNPQSAQSQSNSICHVTSDDINSKKSDRPNIPLVFMRDNPGASQATVKISSLCDTGASHSVLPYRLAKHMNLKIDTSVPVYIRTASNARVQCVGKTWLYTRHPESNT